MSSGTTNKRKLQQGSDTNGPASKQITLTKIKVVDIDSETGKKKFSCVICSDKFDSHGLLLEHFRKHGQVNTNNSLGRNTLETRKPQSLIECEWCPETFVNLSRAIEHKFRKHKYESTNYFCEICGKLFPLKLALEQHYKMEHKDTELSPSITSTFACHYCANKFQTQEALALHLNTAHQLQKRMMAHTFIPEPSKKVKLNQAGEVISMYYCHLCGSEYMVKYNLMKHVEGHHTVEEKSRFPKDLVKCSTCDSVFYTKKAFYAHNVHHKPDDLYVTSEEHRRSIVARVDQDFDIRRVPTTLDKLMQSSKSTISSAAALSKRYAQTQNIPTNPIKPQEPSTSTSYLSLPTLDEDPLRLD